MLQNNLHLPGQYYHFEVDGQNRLGVLQLRHALVLQCLPEKIRELKSCMELAPMQSWAQAIRSNWKGWKTWGLAGHRPCRFAFKQKREKRKALAVCVGSLLIWIMIESDKGESKPNF